MIDGHIQLQGAGVSIRTLLIHLNATWYLVIITASVLRYRISQRHLAPSSLEEVLAQGGHQ